MKVLFTEDPIVESIDAIARLIIQKDDEHSEIKIQEILSFKMCARLTQEGDCKCLVK